MPSFSSALPIIDSTEKLAQFLRLSEFELKRFCMRSNSFYHVFERAKKSGNGVRSICAPSDALKKLQRRIKREILDHVEVHDSCTGYRRGHSIVSNAAAHVGQRFVLNMDIQDFFQSISSARVAGLFVSLGYPEDVAVLLSRLCCYKNAVPQGAPTSPSIANLICHKLDRRLQGLVLRRGMKYTRYCDDITISGDSYMGPALQKLIRTILQEEGFCVNEKKTRLLSRRSCQTVTGLTVNDKVNIPRRRRRRIRAIFHRAIPIGYSSESRRNYLTGLSSFLHMIRAGKRTD